MNDFNIVAHEVIAKANKQNNSGYLSNQYEQCNNFPDIQDYHFRIEDDKTIIELQKLYNQSQPQQINYKQETNSKFSQKMNSLISLLDSKAPNKMPTQKLNIENTQFNPQQAYKQMIERLNNDTVTEGIRKLSIDQQKPVQMIKFKKRGDNLVTKMNKLDIQQY